MMKKTVLFLAAGILSLAANARILRVNNTSGGSTPYTTIAAALEAATDGDTIMVDASGTAYDNPNIEKSIVLLGPGYNLIKNGITEEGASCAQMGDHDTKSVTVTAPGVVIKGMTFSSSLYIQTEKVVVNKCYVSSNISLNGDANNSIIHQNFVRYGIGGGSYDYEIPSYVQVTNNITLGNISGIKSGYIAYNTILVNDSYNLYTCRGCTIEHNWSQVELARYDGVDTNNNLSDNYVSEDFAEFNRYKADEADFAALDVPARNSYGAFAGSTPYVLSGVPAGPVVQDLVVPARVEQGSKLQVTIKVGSQQ